MAAFMKMDSPISRSYVAEQGVIILGLSETLLSSCKFIRDTPIFLVAFLLFCIRKVVLNLTVFLRLRETLVATLNETHVQGNM